VATDMGMPKHEEDFGQTLAVTGVGEGPYLMLPLLGPSNPRDLVGLIADIFTDPWPYVVESEAFGPAVAGAEVIDKRSRNIERIDELEATSLDYYATVRSLYRQHRNDEIRNGRPQVISPLDVLQDVVPSSVRGN
jgi:phospholipid-binding lipoprotein MlaA